MHVDINARIETRWSRVGDFVGLRAVLYDIDPLADDLLAEGVVEDGGRIYLRFDVARIRSADSPLETAPDLRLVVVAADRQVVFRSRVVVDVLLPPGVAKGGRRAIDVTFVESALE